MNHVSFFKKLFESIPENRKIVLLIFSFKNDVDLSNESGYLGNDINRLCLEFKNVLLEQIEEYLDYVKNEGESTAEKILNK